METRVDAFLGGRLSVRQPVNGYRAGADPVFLAAAVPAKTGDCVLELGCGVGTAFLCLAARVDGLDICAVELNCDLAGLAQQNAKDNAVDAEIVSADIAALPATLTEQSFDHVFFNPPFFDRDTGSVAENETREAGRGIVAPNAVWTDVALKRLKPGGSLTLINRMDHLPETLLTLNGRAGSVRVLPLQPRSIKPAKLFILTAKKGSHGAFRICPPLVLHRGERHVEDGDSYTDDASRILRSPSTLDLSC